MVHENTHHYALLPSVLTRLPQFHVIHESYKVLFHKPKGDTYQPEEHQQVNNMHANTEYVYECIFMHGNAIIYKQQYWTGMKHLKYIN